MNIIKYYCPECNKELNEISGGALACRNGHTYRYVESTKVPLFDCEDESANEYTVEQAAEIHENSLKWLFATFGGSEEDLRENLISRLQLQKGQSILITGAGAGNDLPYIASQVGKEGCIYAQDYAKQMLLAAVDRVSTVYDLADYNIEFSISDATNLPFKDDCFDAVYHFGGINLFPDVGKGISEMDRVVKSEGRVVFGDEGMPPWLRNTEYGRVVINNNNLCAFEAPLFFLPHTARDVKLSWEVGYCFYIIEYTASNTALPIDIDVLHVGKRGGTMRTRFYGKMEGIDPDLRDRVFEEAKKRGLSRVEFIEKILRNRLKEQSLP